MLEIALRHKPHAACIVPERREERTTEGGLDAAGSITMLAPMVKALCDANIRVSLFIEPDAAQIEAAMRLGAPVVEFHTGATRIWPGRRARTSCAASPTPPRSPRERDRAACRPRADLRQCRSDRRDPPARRAQHRPLSDRRGDLHGLAEHPRLCARMMDAAR
jgi:hypothetical protein